MCVEVAEVGAALDGLLGLDADVLSDTSLGEAVVELHRLQARLAAATTRLTAAFDARQAWADDGCRSCTTWLVYRCHVPPKQARATLQLGRRLRSMPHTDAALAAGDIGLAQAERLAGLNGSRTAEAFAESEAQLVDHARSLDWVDFTRACAYWRQLADPEGVESDAASDESLRRVHLSPGMNGSGILDGVLTPLGHATVAEALGRIERELFEADWAEARARLGEAAKPADLARTPAQRRADALVEMANRAMTAPKDGKRPRPLVSIYCGYETFAGRICELADGTVLAPGAVARLLDEALIERVVFDGPSRVLDLGESRLFTGALRRAIELRDRHCTAPGCHIPGHRCEADHVVPRSRGGPTTQGNGRLACGGDHRLRHRRDSAA
jgi:hypothetical protein